MVTTLYGVQIGYIPRDATQRFQQPLCFGLVYSVGQSLNSGQGEGDRKWGVRAAVKPNVPPVVVLPVPDRVNEVLDVTRKLKGEVWEQVQQQVLQRSNNT